jgi:hypothetical protein
MSLQILISELDAAAKSVTLLNSGEINWAQDEESIESDLNLPYTIIIDPQRQEKERNLLTRVWSVEIEVRTYTDDSTAEDGVTKAIQRAVNRDAHQEMLDYFLRNSTLIGVEIESISQKSALNQSLAITFTTANIRYEEAI